eukprot:TRINITY_DN6921_c0_g1_i2.p1 TRINITY_DN6921_c0_g1~~TRINITY_DN6921_c0_g1_i2.p1  ORF type:complete len:1206 (+),score=318.18 TRINITY_DN6921_c0_g1_i2:229-3846(+)
MNRAKVFGRQSTKTSGKSVEVTERRQARKITLRESHACQVSQNRKSTLLEAGAGVNHTCNEVATRRSIFSHAKSTLQAAVAVQDVESGGGSARSSIDREARKVLLQQQRKTKVSFATSAKAVAAGARKVLLKTRIADSLRTTAMEKEMRQKLSDVSRNLLRDGDVQWAQLFDGLTELEDECYALENQHMNSGSRIDLSEISGEINEAVLLIEGVEQASLDCEDFLRDILCDDEAGADPENTWQKLIDARKFVKTMRKQNKKLQETLLHFATRDINSAAVTAAPSSASEKPAVSSRRSSLQLLAEADEPSRMLSGVPDDLCESEEEVDEDVLIRPKSAGFSEVAYLLQSVPEDMKELLKEAILQKSTGSVSHEEVADEASTQLLQSLGATERDIQMLMDALRAEAWQERIKSSLDAMEQLVEASTASLRKHAQKVATRLCAAFPESRPLLARRREEEAKKADEQAEVEANAGTLGGVGEEATLQVPRADDDVSSDGMRSTGDRGANVDDDAFDLFGSDDEDARSEAEAQATEDPGGDEAGAEPSPGAGEADAGFGGDAGGASASRASCLSRIRVAFKTQLALQRLREPSADSAGAAAGHAANLRRPSVRGSAPRATTYTHDPGPHWSPVVSVDPGTNARFHLLPGDSLSYELFGSVEGEDGRREWRLSGPGRYRMLLRGAPEDAEVEIDLFEGLHGTLPLSSSRDTLSVEEGTLPARLLQLQLRSCTVILDPSKGGIIINAADGHVPMLLPEIGAESEAADGDDNLEEEDESGEAQADTPIVEPNFENWEKRQQTMVEAPAVPPLDDQSELCDEDTSSHLDESPKKLLRNNSSATSATLTVTSSIRTLLETQTATASWQDLTFLASDEEKDEAAEPPRGTSVSAWPYWASSHTPESRLRDFAAISQQFNGIFGDYLASRESSRLQRDTAERATEGGCESHGKDSLRGFPSMLLTLQDILSTSPSTPKQSRYPAFLERLSRSPLPRLGTSSSSSATSAAVAGNGSRRRPATSPAAQASPRARLTSASASASAQQSPTAARSSKKAASFTSPSRPSPAPPRLQPRRLMFSRAGAAVDILPVACSDGGGPESLSSTAANAAEKRTAPPLLLWTSEGSERSLASAHSGRPGVAGRSPFSSPRAGVVSSNASTAAATPRQPRLQVLMAAAGADVGSCDAPNVKPSFGSLSFTGETAGWMLRGKGGTRLCCS